MVTENILITDFKNKIDNSHIEIESLLQRVAKKQKWIVLGIILFNIIAYFILQLISQGSGEIWGIDNPYICLVLTIFLAFVPFPDAIGFGRNELNRLKLDLKDINPKYNYNGTWKYNVRFFVDSENDRSIEYNILEQNMNDFLETGKSVFKQDALLLSIEYGSTQAEDDDLTKPNTVPIVIWQSSPIALSPKSMEWHFEGKIKWKNNVVYENRFVGIEKYRVVETDTSERPTRLEGSLTGYVHMGTHCYLLSGNAIYERIKEEKNNICQ